MKKFVFILSLLSVLPTSFAEEIPGQTLLSYFSANCKSKGEWTEAALASSIALVESLRSVANDSDCKSVSGAISQLGMLNQQLTNLTKTSETKAKLAEYDRQEQELLTQISNNPAPATLGEINAKLRDLQVLRAGLVGREKSESEMIGPEKTEILASVVQMTNAAFTQVASNQKCMDKNPNILNAATSVVASVGATVAMVNPALGIGLTAGAAVLGETVEGFRKYKNTRELRKITDGSIALEAYKCALETMSEHWCQMQDAISFLDFKDQYRQYPDLNEDLGSAVRLNDREIPVLLDWLNKIRSGVTPTNPADANRQAEVISRESYIRILEKSGIANINDNRAIFNASSDLTERRNIIKSVIRSIVPASEMTFKNPFYEVLNPAYAPFYLLGKEDDSSIRDPNNAYYTLDTWPQFNVEYIPNLDKVAERYLEWVRRASKRVNSQLTQVLQPDALQTLTNAYDRSGNRWKISPMDSLKKLITFLEHNPPSEENIAFKKIFENTLTKIKAIHAITQDAILLSSLDNPDVTVVEKIYELAQLQYGTVVIEARLDTIVRLSLLELLQNSTPEDQVLVAQLLAAERFTETISRMNSKTSTQIRADIYRAQPVTISNLTSFMEVFGKNVKGVLKRIHKEEQKTTGTVAMAKRYSRTELCFLLLSVPEAGKHVDLKMCEGLKFGPILKGGPESITLSSDSYKLDLNDRACEYREFFRKSKIYETWGIK